MTLEEFIIKQNNNEKNESKLINDYNVNSQQLVASLVGADVSHVNFIVLGNSLSSGYSMSDQIKPFFDQNDILKNHLTLNNIAYDIYNFGLVAGNSNGNILNVLNENRSLEYIKKVFAHDLNFAESVANSKKIGAAEIKAYKRTGYLPVGTISEQDYQDFYKINEADNTIKILDLLKDKKAGAQNIVIINGFTGELMDMIFRGGKLELLPHYLKEEFKNMYAILKTIIAQDHEVMIILGAVPNFTLNRGRIPVLGPVIGLYNRAIKENIESVTNTYVTKSINIGLLHNNEGHIIADCHGNQTEYLALSNSFVKTGADNFLSNHLFTLYQNAIKNYIESYYLEPSTKYSIDYGLLSGELNDILEYLITSNSQNNSKLLSGLTMFRNYYNKYYHDSFFPTGKKEINELLESQKLILKKSI